MSRLPSSKLGLKYCSGVMAVGLVWLNVCVISACKKHKTASVTPDRSLALGGREGGWVALSPLLLGRVVLHQGSLTMRLVRWLPWLVVLRAGQEGRQASANCVSHSLHCWGPRAVQQCLGMTAAGFYCLQEMEAVCLGLRCREG